jgi:hypothetical protein
LVSNPELPAEGVAQQLGRTDGGAVAIRRYGDLDEGLHLIRVVVASVAARDATNVPSLRKQCRWVPARY